MFRILNRLVRWRRYDRPFRQALTAYEHIFRDMLLEMHGEQSADSVLLTIDFYWHPDSESFDAVAARFFSHRTVMMKVGCWIDLQIMANAIFRSKDMLTSVGNPADELRTFADSFNPQIEEETDDAPRCPIRREAASLTVEFALILIALHEIAHHALGHIDRSRSFFGFRALSESLVQPQTAPLEVARPAQLQEIEADRFAFSYLSLLLAGNDLPFSKQLVEHPELRCATFELGVLAFTLILHFLRGYGRRLDFYDGCVHPHPILRLIAGVTAMKANNWRVSEERMIQAIEQSISLLANSADSNNLRTIFFEQREEIKQRCAAFEEELAAAPCRRRFSFRNGRWE